MQAIALGFLCGVMLVQWLPALPPVHCVRTAASSLSARCSAEIWPTIAITSEYTVFFSVSIFRNCTYYTFHVYFSSIRSVVVIIFFFSRKEIIVFLYLKFISYIIITFTFILFQIRMQDEVVRDAALHGRRVHQRVHGHQDNHAEAYGIFSRETV